MKKGFILTLGTIIIAMAGSSFATTPTISGVPDVVISDTEDNAQVVGATVDLNFFRFISAFNIAEYVNDADSDASDLVFAFREQNDNENLQINGKLGLSESEFDTPVPTNWVGLDKELVDADGVSPKYWFDFRDILRSETGRTEGDPSYTEPHNKFDDPVDVNGDPVATDVTALLPWQNVASGDSTLSGDSRSVYILVGDEGDSVASDVITVYSENFGADALSGTFTTIFTDDSFTAWTYGLEGVGASAATSSTGGSGDTYIALQGGGDASTGGLFFGRWKQNSLPDTYGGLTSPIPVVDATNLIYCAKLTMEIGSAPNGKDRVPQIRLGAQNTLQNMVTLNIVGSANISNETVPSTANGDQNPQVPAVGTEQIYTLYWSSNSQAPESSMIDARTGLVGLDWGRFNLFFDMIDSNKDATSGLDDSGTWQINYVEVGTLNRPADVAGEDYADLRSSAGWSSEGATTGSSVLENSNGSVTFDMAAASGATYALWRKGAAVDWVGGTIVRTTAYLSVPTAGDRTTFPTARIRHNTFGAWFDQVWLVAGSAAATAIDGKYPLIPDTVANTPNGTAYETYVPTYAGPGAYVAYLMAAPPAGLGLADVDTFTVALDSVNTTATDAATQWTAHEVTCEVLDDPLNLN